MENKKVFGGILFALIFIIFISLLTLKTLLSSYSGAIWLIWIILFIYFLYWLHKNTDFFKNLPFAKRTEHRARVLQQIMFFDIMRYIGYVCELFFIGVGIFFLFTNNPQRWGIFFMLVFFAAVLFGIQTLGYFLLKKSLK